MAVQQRREFLTVVDEFSTISQEVFEYLLKRVHAQDADRSFAVMQTFVTTAERPSSLIDKKE